MYSLSCFEFIGPIRVFGIDTHKTTVNENGEHDEEVEIGMS